MSLFLKDRGFGFGFGFGFWHCIKLGFFIFFFITIVQQQPISHALA